VTLWNLLEGENSSHAPGSLMPVSQKKLPSWRKSSVVPLGAPCEAITAAQPFKAFITLARRAW
jgi:hypothetical protein